MKPQCWCQQGQLDAFNDHYLRCNACLTLISIKNEAEAGSGSTGELASFYGIEYWLSHQNELGNPDIYRRLREDLSDRCLYWLKHTLAYKLPQGNSLELGSSHGGFVYLLQQAGFRAQGLELDHDIAELARKTFGISVLLGPVEEQAVEPASQDLVILMDVLEHLPDPVQTIRTCAQILKPDGVLVIQTPCYPAETSYQMLLEQDQPFLKMLLPQEHLYLFNKTSVEKLLEQCGLTHFSFEPAFFDMHDMFVFASKAPMCKKSWPEIETFMASQMRGRLIMALFDLQEKNHQSATTLAEVEFDRANRLDMIIDLNKKLAEAYQRIDRLQSTLDQQSRLSRIFLRIARFLPVRTIRKLFKF